MSVGTLQTFLAVEAATFGIASLIHRGLVIPGYAHRNAHIAEAVLAIVLAAGLVITVVTPEHARRAGLLAQGFALLGTLVGILTIALGVGPRTVPDVVYHIAVVIILAVGLRYTQRAAELRTP